MRHFIVASRVASYLVVAPTLALGASGAPAVAPSHGPAKTTPTPDAATTTVHVESVAGRWYGGQILMVDGAAATLVTVGVLSGPPSAFRTTTVIAGFGGYLFGPPLVHCLHGNFVKALGSFGARYLLPAAGLGLGFLVGQCSGDRCNPAPAAAGAFTGLALTYVLDAGVLAYDRAPKPKAPSPGRAQLTPTLAASPEGATLGVAGVF